MISRQVGRPIVFSITSGRSTLKKALFAATLSIIGAICGNTVALAQSGYQTIQGTRVFTVIDQSRGIATFSNDCGSQMLTQRQLQAGAIPNNIIPCPRPNSGRNSTLGGIERERICRDGSYCKPNHVCQSDGNCKPNARLSVCHSALFKDMAVAVSGNWPARLILLEEALEKCRDFPEFSIKLEADIETTRGWIAESASRRTPRSTPSDSGDATHCIKIVSKSEGDYIAENACSYKVLFVLETMEFHPKKTVRDKLYVEANDTEEFITSYHGVTPVVISACRSGSGCQ